MPVAIVMEFKGATLHDAIRVTDVWETAEQYQQFAAEQIGPYAQEAGIPAPPELTFYDVHNHLTPAPS